MTPPTPAQRLRGLAATLLIAILIAGIPVLLLAIGAAPWNTDLADLRTRLASPDDGTLAMTLIAAIAWIAWAVLAITLILEIVSQIRGIPTPTLTGLGAPQRAAGHLVATAALLIVAAPTLVAAFPTAPAHSTPAQPASAAPLPTSAPLHAAPLPPQAAPLPAGPAPLPANAAPLLTATGSGRTGVASVDYTVRRGDSLWKIADQFLGDGRRFPEIVALNQTVLNGRPDFIVPGTILKVPQPTKPTSSGHRGGVYVVQPGDTLSEIAEAQLGDPTRYPELFAASRAITQPDGARLTDPDLIQPGWKITIPGPGRHKADHVEAPDHQDPPATPEPGVEVEPPSGGVPPDEAPTSDPTDESATETDPTTIGADDVDIAAAAGSALPGWVLPGLTGAGAVLATGVLLGVRAHRHTQLRYRRPGQRIAPPPPELRAVEKTAFSIGSPLAPVITNLDRALLHLAGHCTDTGRPQPRLVYATLRQATVTLHLAEESDLPEPWTGNGCEWTLDLEEPLEERHDVLPPYPLLVTIGADQTGLCLLNLEHLRVTTLAGDPERAASLARHIAAELALNPWSVLVQVDTIGIADELATLDNLRLHHHPDGDQTIPTIVRAINATIADGSGDPEPYRAVITSGHGTNELAVLLTAPSVRTGAALVSLAAPPSESTVLDINPTGRLRMDTLGLDLHAAGLTSQEAAACAAIVDLTRESPPIPVEPLDLAADNWQAYTDQAGALLEEHTTPRGDDPAGDGSLLPGATEEYVAAAATTTEDINALAPIVTAEVRQAIEEADPTLDQDVDDWFNPEPLRPRLTLLGHVTAEATGEMKPMMLKRRPYFVEILAYLALHPKGVTSTQIAETFGIGISKARTDISTLRDWLGTNPATQTPYLPAANESPTYLDTGIKTYQVQDILLDLDLFRRLRARGQARGTYGIEDLTAAMSLVHGVPFSHLRDKGWSWLLDTERLHETIGCAIVDTAHILVTHALANHDLAFARHVAETACDAAPHDDICRLDLVKVAATEGHHKAAEQMLTDHIHNRTDDHMPPIDTPERTATITGTEQAPGTSRGQGS